MKIGTIKLGMRQAELNLKDIVYFEADVNYTKIHMASGRTNVISYTLKKIEKRLGGLPTFCRVHRSFIINMDYIKTIQPTEILLKNKQTVLFSRRCRKQNLEKLLNI